MFHADEISNRYLLHYTPAVADHLKQWHMTWLILMVIAHFVEAIHMMKSRLRRHGTPRYGLVWWQWVIGTLFEGFGSFLRFDQAVADVKGKSDKGKH